MRPVTPTSGNPPWWTLTRTLEGMWVRCRTMLMSGFPAPLGEAFPDQPDGVLHGDEPVDVFRLQYQDHNENPFR